MVVIFLFIQTIFSFLFLVSGEFSCQFLLGSLFCAGRRNISEGSCTRTYRLFAGQTLQFYPQGCCQFFARHCLNYELSYRD